MNTKRRMKDGSSIMDIDYTAEVATPHVPWAAKLPGGPIKAFFLPSVKGGRDYSELMQRLDVDAVSVTHDRAWDLDKWGFGDFYDKRVRIWEYETVYSYMVDAITSDEHFDLIVLQSVNGWGFWPKEFRAAVLDRVKKGAGLVLVHPFEGEKPSPELAQLSPLVGCPNDTVDDGGYAVIAHKHQRTGAWKSEGSHFITKGIPLDALATEELAYYPYKADGKVILTAGDSDPLAAVKTFGKGRVVAFGWYNRDLAPQHKDHIKPVGGLSSNSDFWQGGFSSCTWDAEEYLYQLLTRACLWAARREPKVSLALSAKAASLTVKLSGGSGSVDVEGSLINEWGAEDLKFSQTAKASGSAITIDLPEKKLSAGTHLARVILKKSGKSLDFAAVRFETPRPAAVASIMADGDVYQPSDKVSADITISGKVSKLTLETALVDAFSRVASKRTLKADAPGALGVSLSRKGILTPQMWLRVRLYDGKRLLDEKKSPRLTAVPDYDRNLHDVELVVAQYDRGRGSYIEPVRRQLLDFGATNGYYGYSKILAESGAEGGGIYWYRRAPYVEQKEKFIRTGDKKYLERVPCLSDPKFLKEVHDTVVKTSKLGTKYAPLSYYVQDEGSLTCYRDENDLCFAPHTLKAMRDWLKSEYADLKALNAEWSTSFKSWNAVVPMTIDEARDHGNLAPWADHRTFMEIVFAEYFKLVRDSVREVDPEGRIRLSGCQVSEPYTGMNYYRLHQIVEYFEAYGGGNQFEFHQSFAGPRTVLGTWIGYGQKGRTSNHKIWDAFLHQIRLFSVFWEFAVVNPDYTLCGSALDMAETFRELRGSGVSRMLFGADRDNTGVAVHYSFPSIHAAYGLAKMERFNRCRQGWLNVLQDLGYQQTFLARQQIEAGDLVKRKFKVLVMPYSLAVSPKEAAEIKKFVKAGGRVLADFQTAVYDDHAKRNEKGSLDDVFGIKRHNFRNEPFFINGEPVRTSALADLDVKAVQDAGVILEEPGVRAAKGEPLFADDFSHNVPALVVNSFGRGKAAYLNFGVDVCASDPDSDKAKAVKAAIGETLAHFKVKPVMTVTDSAGAPLDHVEMLRYSVPGIEYYACLRENVGSGVTMAYDGIVHGGHESEAVAEPITVTLPARGHVYDCIEKKYLGPDVTFQSAIKPAQAKVFAVLPYEVSDLSVEVKPSGSTVRFSAAVSVSSGKPKEHTIVLDVTDPAGRRSPLYSKNLLAKSGKASGAVQFSLEGESGAWKLSFTEAASGISKSVEVMVP